MLERDIEAYLYRQVEALGGRCFKWVCPQHNGVPDRIVMVLDQVWFIELKKNPSGDLRKLQYLVGNMIKQFTSNYCVIRSKEAVDEFIQTVKGKYATKTS